MLPLLTTLFALLMIVSATFCVVYGGVRLLCWALRPFDEANEELFDQ